MSLQALFASFQKQVFSSRCLRIPLGTSSSGECWVTEDCVNEGRVLLFISCNCRHDIIISISQRMAEKKKKNIRGQRGVLFVENWTFHLICDLVKRTHISTAHRAWTKQRHSWRPGGTKGILYPCLLLTLFLNELPRLCTLGIDLMGWEVQRALAITSKQVAPRIDLIQPMTPFRSRRRKRLFFPLSITQLGSDKIVSCWGVPSSPHWAVMACPHEKAWDKTTPVTVWSFLMCAIEEPFGIKLCAIYAHDDKHTHTHSRQNMLRRWLVSGTGCSTDNWTTFFSL